MTRNVAIATTATVAMVQFTPAWLTLWAGVVAVYAAFMAWWGYRHSERRADRLDQAWWRLQEAWFRITRWCVAHYWDELAMGLAAAYVAHAVLSTMHFPPLCIYSARALAALALAWFALNRVGPRKPV